MASRPDGDVWNIVDNDVESQHYGRNFKFDFSYISSKEIKDVVKDYVWQNYRVGNKAISTLYKHLNFDLVRFFTFVENENKELSELTNADICLYDFRRGNCTDGDGCFFYNCPNYITEVQFYPILKDELDLLEKEMARLKELGQEPAYQVQAVKYKYLKPLVESLEVQLNV